MQQPPGQIADQAAALQQGNERVGHVQHTAWVLPTHQCFDTANDVVTKADLGLIDERKFLMFERVAQLSEQDQSRRTVRIHAVIV